MMPRERQITAVLENRPGELLKLCYALRDQNVNIAAMMVVEGRARIIVDNSVRAGAVLESMGIPYTMAEVISLEIPNKPGSVAEVVDKMAKAGINIDYAFASTVPNQDTATVIFAVSDLDRASEVVNNP